MPTYTTLITSEDLATHLDDPNWAIVDCRFSLTEPESGRTHYLESHIPGAVYVHLDNDLSGPKLTGVTGRHPLPSIAAAVATFSRLGISSGIQVVAYDDMGGALAAGRLWWMLRWLGHVDVAVLDGGWQSWIKLGYAQQASEQTRPFRPFAPRPGPVRIANTDQVEALQNDPAWRLLDARASERYRGENETIDPIAGHIPGAISAPYINNLTPEGTFKPVEQLRQQYIDVLNGVPPEHCIVYCGSGVTSIHNVLAMLHAGLGEAQLYAGSWSEWITDPHRLVASGSPEDSTDMQPESG